MAWAVAGVLAGTAVLYGLFLSAPSPEPETGGLLSAVDVLSGEPAEGFARAEAPRAFRFPEDHGPHPDYRTEWWYVTGHLDGPGEESFGFQVTFFRSALSPDPPEEESEWSTRQVYLAHFAVTDVDGGRHRSFERMARGAVGMAGAQAEPFRVWVDHWTLESHGDDLFPLRVSAETEEVGLELLLRSGKPLVPQGEDGWSPKGPEPGNASYYYSFTRLPAEGTVRFGDRRVEVTGEAWMDREWSTSALGDGQVGWDWFALQLDDGRELMYFELRRRDGSPDPHDYGIVVERDGATRTLSGEDVELTVLDRWRSPVDGTEYPSRWSLQVPSEGVDLELRPRVQDQEVLLTFRYWEGALDVHGRGPDGELSGRGYAELTGYAESAGRGGAQP